MTLDPVDRSCIVDADFPDAAQLLTTCPRRLAGARLWLGFSGGGDSTILLHALAQAGLAGLHAVHIDHGLQADSGTWARHCADICARLAIPLHTIEVACDMHSGLGLEAAARTARRTAFLALLKHGDILITAHHRDDQVETLLLRLLRGTGIEGLAAMRPETRFGGGTLWRPLLRVSRASVRAALIRSGLRYINDPHNADPRLARARLRGGLLPILRERIPDLDRRLAQLATAAAIAADRVTERVDSDRVAVGGDQPRIPELLALGRLRRLAVLRRWMATASGGPPPGMALLERIDRELLRARGDAEPELAFGAYRLRRHRDRIHLTAILPTLPGHWQVKWIDQSILDLPPGAGRLVADRPPPEPLTICFARGGERIRPAKGKCRRTLKNLLREAGLPSWERPFLPLLYDAGRLIAIADRWRTDECLSLCADNGWDYHWEPGLSGFSL